MAQKGNRQLLGHTHFYELDKIIHEEQKRKEKSIKRTKRQLSASPANTRATSGPIFRARDTFVTTNLRAPVAASLFRCVRPRPRCSKSGGGRCRSRFPLGPALPRGRKLPVLERRTVTRCSTSTARMTIGVLVGQVQRSDTPLANQMWTITSATARMGPPDVTLEETGEQTSGCADTSSIARRNVRGSCPGLRAIRRDEAEDIRKRQLDESARHAGQRRSDRRAGLARGAEGSGDKIVDLRTVLRASVATGELLKGFNRSSPLSPDQRNCGGTIHDATLLSSHASDRPVNAEKKSILWEPGAIPALKAGSRFFCRPVMLRGGDATRDWKRNASSGQASSESEDGLSDSRPGQVVGYYHQ